MSPQCTIFANGDSSQPIARLVSLARQGNVAKTPGVHTQIVRVHQGKPDGYFDRDQCADSMTDSINTLRNGFMKGAA